MIAPNDRADFTEMKNSAKLAHSARKNHSTGRE
jgi:hypothetical protein